MASLTPQQLHDRLKFDYQVAMAMRSPIMSVSAFRSIWSIKETKLSLRKKAISQPTTE